MSKQGYVYLIQAGDSFRFKIGRSVDPERRVKEMQVGSALELKLLCQKRCRDMCAQEDRWHELFGASRKHGEWFDLDEKQLPKIVTALKGDIGVHFSKRTVDDLKVGEKYYISWDSRKVEEVVLLEVPGANGHPTVSVRRLKTGSVHSLYPDEIRESPVSAIFNRVTF